MRGNSNKDEEIQSQIKLVKAKLKEFVEQDVMDEEIQDLKERIAAVQQDLMSGGTQGKLSSEHAPNKNAPVRKLAPAGMSAADKSKLAKLQADLYKNQ